jgi:hypothetical protein
MSYVLLIWFSVGVAPIEHFDNSAACFKRLGELVPLYAKSFVIKSSGCYPDALIVEAVRSSSQTAAKTR